MILGEKVGNDIICGKKNDDSFKEAPAYCRSSLDGLQKCYVKVLWGFVRFCNSKALENYIRNLGLLLHAYFFRSWQNTLGRESEVLHELCKLNDQGALIWTQKCTLAILDWHLLIKHHINHLVVSSWISRIMEAHFYFILVFIIPSLPHPCFPIEISLLKEGKFICVFCCLYDTRLWSMVLSSVDDDDIVSSF